MRIVEGSELFFNLALLKNASIRLGNLAQNLESYKLNVKFDISCGDTADHVSLLAEKYNLLGSSLVTLIRDVQNSVEMTREEMKKTDEYLSRVWASNHIVKGSIAAKVVAQNSEKKPQGTTEKVVSREDAKVIEYNGTSYSTIENVKEEYFYNQNDYKKFEKSNGSNVGCTATAEAIAYSIYHNEKVTPDQMGWGSSGAEWNHSQKIENTQYMSETGRYSVIYENLSQGKPVLVRLPGHHVTAVGIREGANVNNLGPGDFLIINPYTGKLDTMADYAARNNLGNRVLDTSGWSLRVPK